MKGKKECLKINQILNKYMNMIIISLIKFYNLYLNDKKYLLSEFIYFSLNEHYIL